MQLMSFNIIITLHPPRSRLFGQKVIILGVIYRVWFSLKDSLIVTVSQCLVSGVPPEILGPMETKIFGPPTFFTDTI